MQTRLLALMTSPTFCLFRTNCKKGIPTTIIFVRQSLPAAVAIAVESCASYRDGATRPGKLPEHFSVGAAEIEASGGPSGIWFDNSGGLAVGDIDADGSVDIVGTVVNGGTVALERDGTFKWYSTEPSGTNHLAGTQPSIADIDGDGKPEVIQGRVVLNGENGSEQWIGTEGLGTNGFYGTGLGRLAMSIYRGRSTFWQAIPCMRAMETVLHSFSLPPLDGDCQNSGYPCDGYTATGNFDADDQGEVVIVRAGVIYILNHDFTPWFTTKQQRKSRSRTITAAKTKVAHRPSPTLMAIGIAEIGVAGADFYIVADLDCLGTPGPECDSDGILWKIANDDCTSRVTGSSVFDFDGDGRAEVLYADEQNFRILDGVDGKDVISPEPNRSHTRLEMPIVVDVDNDGNAEVVFVENGPGKEPIGGTTSRPTGCSRYRRRDR